MSRPAGAALRFCVRTFLLLFSMALLVGCQTRAAINDVMMPLQYIKSVVKTTMPQGVRSESTNGREYKSNFFSPDSFDEEAPEDGDRAYAVMKVLGASRPYQVDVQVFREKRLKHSFAKPTKDQVLTEELTDRVREALADRREDRNVIDDFRAF